MTLCIAWNAGNKICIASDSRLTIASNSYSDVGIKVTSIPFSIHLPVTENESIGTTTPVFFGSLGLGFAGSALNSLVLKESITEILKTTQLIPSYTDISLEGVSNYLFKFYTQISDAICNTSIGGNGRSDLIITGKCPKHKKLKAFRLSTDKLNNKTIIEILQNKNDLVFLGNGSNKAEELKSNGLTDPIEILKNVINDPNEPSVGGNIQYGEANSDTGQFNVFGVSEIKNGKVHNWRGAIDLNDPAINTRSNLISNLPYIIID